MLTEDTSFDRVNRVVEMCKKDVKLTPETQSQRESGHSSADYGSGPPQSAANPSGSPGTGRSKSY